MSVGDDVLVQGNGEMIPAKVQEVSSRIMEGKACFIDLMLNSYPEIGDVNFKGLFGFFTISKSDRRYFRQINSGKINLLKKLPPVGIELVTATITHLKNDAEPMWTSRHVLNWSSFK